MFVGNNWDGTADVIKSGGDFAKIGRINVIPDKDERLAEINADPIKWISFMAIRNGVGEGHDQFVDDMYSTPDGSADGRLPAQLRRRRLDRPRHRARSTGASPCRVTAPTTWRSPPTAPGSRSRPRPPTPCTCWTSSPASRSARSRPATSRTRTSSPSDGKYLWNMSIGDVNTATDADLAGLDEGRPARSPSSTRPPSSRSRSSTCASGSTPSAARTCPTPSAPPRSRPDESKLYFQVSFFNGFFEYDVATDKITRVKTLPKNPATSEDRTTWVNDSRHHGMSMSPDGDKLCVAGTMDDYATIVDRATLQEGPLVTASKPYWATVSGDGKSCVISESGSDQVTAIDFATGQEDGVGGGRRPPAARPPGRGAGGLDRPVRRLTSAQPAFEAAQLASSVRAAFSSSADGAFAPFVTRAKCVPESGAVRSSRRLPVPPGSSATAIGVVFVYEGGAAVVPRSETTVVEDVGKDAGRCSSVGAELPSERHICRAY